MCNFSLHQSYGANIFSLQDVKKITNHCIKRKCHWREISRLTFGYSSENVLFFFFFFKQKGCTFDQKKKKKEKNLKPASPTLCTKREVGWGKEVCIPVRSCRIFIMVKINGKENQGCTGSVYFLISCRFGVWAWTLLWCSFSTVLQESYLNLLILPINLGLPKLLCNSVEFIVKSFVLLTLSL